MEKYTLEQHEAYVEAQEKKRKAEEHLRRERIEKETARRAWLADGGDEEDFERQWPAMRDEARRRRIAEADRRVRGAMSEPSRI